MGLNYTNSTANEKPDGNSFFSPMNSVTIIGNFHDIWTRDANGNIKAVGERGRINPVSVIEDIKQKQSTSRIISNFGVKMKPRSKIVSLTELKNGIETLVLTLCEDGSIWLFRPFSDPTNMWELIWETPS